MDERVYCANSSKLMYVFRISNVISTLPVYVKEYWGAQASKYGDFVVGMFTA